MPKPKWREGYATTKRSKTLPPDAELPKIFIDESDPHCLVNVAPEVMVAAIRTCLQKYPTFFLHTTERDIRDRACVDERDEKFRLLFWDEFNAATALGRRMLFRNIVYHFLSPSIWYNYYAVRMDKLCFILYPPASYTNSLKLVLSKGLAKLQEIMDLPILTPAGQPDIRVITQILKVFQIVDARIKGAVVQRVQIQQQSLNINADASNLPGSIAPDLTKLTLDQLEVLEQKLLKADAASSRLIATLPEESRAEVLAVKNGDEPVNPLDRRVVDISDFPEDAERLVE